jgi:hypothetical protein
MTQQPVDQARRCNLAERIIPSLRMSSGLRLSSSARLLVGSWSQIMILACFGLKYHRRSACRPHPPSGSNRFAPLLGERKPRHPIGQPFWHVAAGSSISAHQLAEAVDETDWARVAAMTEADIERAAAGDPHAALTTAGDWTDAGRLAADDGTGHVTARSGCPRMVSAAGTGVSGPYQRGPSRLRQGASALADPRLRRSSGCAHR